MNTQIEILHQAWHRMFLERTCPPLSVLKKGGPLVEQHLKICPTCQANLAHLSDFEALGSMLGKVTFPNRDSTQAKIGHIRRIRPSTAPETWFDAYGRYYNPPEVVVLSDPDEHGCVRVAQIFSGAGLNFANEVPLADSEDEFAEAWNIYELPVSALAPKTYRSVGLEVVERILLAAKDPISEIRPGTTLFYFHKCERELATFFQGMFQKKETTADEEVAVSRRAKVVFFNRSGVDKSDLTKQLVQKAVSYWPKYVQDLPLAAADSLEINDGCTEQMNLPCLLVRQSADSLEEIHQTLCAEVHIFRLPDATVCAGYCHLPVDLTDICATVTCRDIQPDLLSMEEYPMIPGVFCINAKFAQPNLDVQELELTVVSV